MVAIINTSKNIRKALLYNENKIKQEKAGLISAKGFAKDHEIIEFSEKLKRFQKNISLSHSVQVNSVHISLNFSPKDKLSQDVLIKISDEYMSRIGFGEQPYLVYQHHDSAHPHLHIVSTNIDMNGKRISLHNIGKNQSENARKEIEIKYGLTKAESQEEIQKQFAKQLPLKNIEYGKLELKWSMTNILNHVLSEYSFDSLPELNAALKRFNMLADCGSENSKISLHGGTIFRALDSMGNKIGPPIKASSFYMKPTIKNLEKLFLRNKSRKTFHRGTLTKMLDNALNKCVSIESFRENLSKQNVDLIIRSSADGSIYGLTYVDHKAKCVFNGSALGKRFSANQVLEQISQQNYKGLLPIETEPRNIQKKEYQSGHKQFKQNYFLAQIAISSIEKLGKEERGQDFNIPEILKDAESIGLNNELKEKSKRKKKKQHH